MRDGLRQRSPILQPYVDFALIHAYYDHAYSERSDTHQQYQNFNL